MDVPESSPSGELGSEAARDAVAAIVEKADERQKARAEFEAEHPDNGPQKPFLARPAVAGSLMVMFVAILALDVYVLTRPTLPPTNAEVESSARMETAVVALQLEAYKQQNGRYPDSLGDAGLELTGVAYVRTAEGYVLEAKGSGPPITHRADQDPEELVRNMPILGEGQ